MSLTIKTKKKSMIVNINVQYQAHCVYRTNISNGGVSEYIKKDLIYEIMEDLPIDNTMIEIVG